MVWRKQTVLAGDGLKPWRDGTGSRGGDQLLGTVGIFMASSLPRVAKVLHGLSYPRDSKFFGDATDGFHYLRMSVGVLVRVEVRRFDSSGTDFFEQCRRGVSTGRAVLPPAADRNAGALR